METFGRIWNSVRHSKIKVVFPRDFQEKFDFAIHNFQPSPETSEKRENAAEDKKVLKFKTLHSRDDEETYISIEQMEEFNIFKYLSRYI